MKMNNQIVVLGNSQEELKERALGIIEKSRKLADSTKRQYKRVITDYAEKGYRLDNPNDLVDYADEASPSARSFLRAVLNRLADKEIQHLRLNATPDNLSETNARLLRAEAIKGIIETEEQKGQRQHTWLSAKEVKELLKACETRASGNPEFEIIAKRDRLAIGLMVCAGLRRLEACNLTFKNITQVPNGSGIRTFLNVKGKGDKDRSIPISDRLADAIQEWGEIVGNEGKVLRSLGRDKVPGEEMSTTSMYNIIQKRGEMIGKPNLQPHDLRRTYAELGRQAGVPIEQISILLGHASIKTTQRYLNIQVNKDVTISDFVPF